MGFLRVARVEVRVARRNGTQIVPGYVQKIVIENLRISFNIQKSESWGTNTANIRIWNLNPDNRNIIKDYGDEVSLFAGYANQPGEQLLFVGDTTKVSHTFAQPEIVTSLECGDGERVLNQRLISVSFQEKIPIRQVIQSVANDMDLGIAYFAPTDNLVFEQGFSFVGMAKNCLDKVTAALGLQWSVQNKQLIIIPNNGTTDRPPYTINADTGMIGVPERFTYKNKDLFTGGPKTGWRVSTVLRPEIVPGDRVDIQSQKVDMKGPFTVDIARHDGDTYGDVWRSNFEVVLV